MEVKDFISITLSLVAFVFTVFGYFHTKKVAENQRKYDRFSTIYMDILLKDIPECYAKLNFKFNANYNGVDEFQRTIQKFSLSIKFIEILDSDVYHEWKKMADDIEDYVVMCDNENNIDIEQNIHFKDELLNKLQKLYHKVMFEKFENILK